MKNICARDGLVQDIEININVEIDIEKAGDSGTSREDDILVT